MQNIAGQLSHPPVVPTVFGSELVQLLVDRIERGWPVRDTQLVLVCLGLN